MSRRWWVLVALATGCGGSTGSSALISFTALAGGPADAVPGQPLTFDNAVGAHVVLSEARLHVGAVYLTDIEPTSGIGEEPCTIPSGQTAAYVAQAFAPPSLEIDLLSPELVAFPTAGEGISLQSKTGQVWLTGGDVNAPVDPTVILSVSGTATQAGTAYPFTGGITISANRAIPASSPAMPGSDPICRLRIVQPIQAALLPSPGGQLQLQIDPRPMFQTVDFSTLVAGSGSTFQIPDTSSGAGQQLYKGVLSSAGVYHFTWAN